jgi:hypothetical protein
MSIYAIVLGAIMILVDILKCVYAGCVVYFMLHTLNDDLIKDAQFEQIIKESIEQVRQGEESESEPDSNFCNE